MCVACGAPSGCVPQCGSLPRWRVVNGRVCCGACGCSTYSVPSRPSTSPSGGTRATRATKAGDGGRPCLICTPKDSIRAKDADVAARATHPRPTSPPGVPAVPRRRTLTNKPRDRTSAADTTSTGTAPVAADGRAGSARTRSPTAPGVTATTRPGGAPRATHPEQMQSTHPPRQLRLLHRLQRWPCLHRRQPHRQSRKSHRLDQRPNRRYAPRSHQQHRRYAHPNHRRHQET